MTMNGYKRTPGKTAELITALSVALAAHPEQRLGQLLDNAAFKHGLSKTDHWNIFDEDWIQWLNDEG